MSQAMRATFVMKSSTNYITYVVIGGNNVRVAFERPVVFGHTANSSFSTTSPELIEALKAHPRFNDVFFLDGESMCVDENHNQGSKELDIKSLLTDPENVVVVDDVTSIVKAKSWLQDTHSAVFIGIKKDDIIKEAAQKYNTIFPNWV